MKPPRELGSAAQVAIAAMVLLGWVGGSLIVAHSGFATSPRRGGTSVFVPAPEAYVLAAAQYGMSVIGLLVLLRHRQAPGAAQAMAVVLYAVAAAVLASVLGPR